MIRVITILLFLIFTLSCTNRGELLKHSFVKIDLDKTEGIEALPKLSEIAESIEYIKLETDSRCLIGDFNEIRITEKYLFISSNNNLLMFNRKTGKFIRKIGSRGKGPEEYQGFKTFEVDEKNSRVYLWDYVMNKFLIYGFNGNLISVIKPVEIENIDVDFFKLTGDNRIIIHDYNFFGNSRYQVYLIDYTGKVINKIVNTHKFKVTFPLSISRNQTNSLSVINSQTISYKYIRNDTIYHSLKNDLSLIPVYVFCADKKSKHKYSKREYIRIYNLFETGDYLFFKRHRNVLYNKADNEIRFSKFNQNGFINDIDGGSNFWPKFAQDNSLITYYNASDLKENLTPEHFKNSITKNPDQTEKLKKLTASLKEDDNPVVVIVTLKKQ